MAGFDTKELERIVTVEPLHWRGQGKLTLLAGNFAAAMLTTFNDGILAGASAQSADS